MRRLSCQATVSRYGEDYALSADLCTLRHELEGRPDSAQLKSGDAPRQNPSVWGTSLGSNRRGGRTEPQTINVYRGGDCSEVAEATDTNRSTTDRRSLIRRESLNSVR